MSEVTILLVEDEFLIRAALAECLEEKGLHVLQADSVHTATSFLKQHSVSLLLTDIHLNKGENGFKLAQKARATNPYLPVIYMSGSSHHQTEISHHQPATNAFIAKPYEPNEVLILIKKLLETPLPPH